MKVKFKGEWYEIQCFNITKNDGTAFISKDYEADIEDIEINGRHLVHLNNEASKTEAAKQQNDKPTEKAGREEKFPAKDGTDLIPPAPDIDWEQRTWEAFLKICNPNDSYEVGSALEKARSVVNTYREKMQL
jgi:hypothetical protein